MTPPTHSQLPGDPDPLTVDPRIPAAKPYRLAASSKRRGCLGWLLMVALVLAVWR